MGNWELVSHLSTEFPEYTFGAIYQSLANPYINDYIRLTNAKAGVSAFQNAVAELAAHYPHNQLLFGSFHGAYANVQDALRPQVVAVWLLAGVLFVASILLASQAIGRQIVAHNRDLSDLRALGLSPFWYNAMPR